MILGTIKSKINCSAGVLMFLMAGCGDEPQGISTVATRTLEQAIINGEKCFESEYPSSLEIIVDATIDFGPMGEYRVMSQICGGTLIAPDVVLTAAHCLDATGLTMGMGKVAKISYSVTSEADLSRLENAQNPEPPNGAILAKAWMVHPKFDMDSFDGEGLGQHHDIALLFLSAPLAIRPAMVIDPKEASMLAVTKEVAIVGWGMQTPQDHDEEPGKTSEITHGVKMCARSNINEIGEFEMQIGSDEQSKRKCYGDSGGATYINLETALGMETRLIGITSHAYDSKACFKGGVDTRVDAYLNWIDEKMKEGCQTKVRSWCEMEGIIRPQSANVESQSILSWIWAHFLRWISRS